MKSNPYVTFRELFKLALSESGESVTEVVACNASGDTFRAVFNEHWAKHPGKQFLAWSKKRVYFSSKNAEGLTRIHSAPRSPA